MGSGWKKTVAVVFVVVVAVVVVVGQGGDSSKVHRMASPHAGKPPVPAGREAGQLLRGRRVPELAVVLVHPLAEHAGAVARIVQCLAKVVP